MAVQIQTAVTPVDSRIIENACQHLRDLSQYLLEERDCQETDKKGVPIIVEALLELDQERTKLHDALEAETIKASILRHKLLHVPLDTEKEIENAVLDARNENMAEISEVQDRLSTTQNTIKNLKLQLEALQEHDSQLNPVKEKINFTHDDMVSDLNFLLNDKAQVQIELNETWEEVKCTKKNIHRTEDGILQLHEDLINERDQAKIQRKELRASILKTKQLKEEQLVANDGAVRQIEKLKCTLTDVKIQNTDRRRDLRLLNKKCDNLYGAIDTMKVACINDQKAFETVVESGKEIGSSFAVMVKEYEARRVDQETQLLKVHKELGEATQNAAKLEKERNQLHNTLKGAKTAAGRSAASLRLLNESLKNSKQELLDQSEEAARLKRENAELEFRIQQANEGHKLNVELLTGQIEEVRESLSYEVEQKNACQREREKLRKKELAWKKEYQFKMNQLTIRIHALKEQNTQLVKDVGVLKNDISAGQILVKELRKKDKIESEESMYVQDELNNDIMELDNLIIKTNVTLVKLQDTLEEMKPVFADKEAQLVVEQATYESKKKTTVEMKGEKQSLEDKITKLKRDIKRLQMPREKLNAQIRDSRFQSLNQIREQARENLDTEQNIDLMHNKMTLMKQQNARIIEHTALLEKDVVGIVTNILTTNRGNRKFLKELKEKKADLKNSYKKDLEMDGLYASVDLGILSDITEMHHTTEMRQEKIADIRAQLEEQLTKMDNFIFRVGSPPPTPQAPPTPKEPCKLPELKPPYFLSQGAQ